MPNDTPDIEQGTDDLGLYARLHVDLTVFSQTAVLKAAYWLTDSLYIFISRTDPSALMIELRIKDNTASDSLLAACGSFANALLDYEVRQRVLAETTTVRDVLIKKAFFEVRKAPPATLVSDESKLSRPGQTAKDDPAGARRMR